MCQTDRKRLRPGESPVVRPPAILWHKLDPSPERLKELGRYRLEDFLPGGIWDPGRPRSWWKPAWWYRWKHMGTPWLH